MEWNIYIFTLKPSSPGFSASKSYKAVQHGCLVIGVLAGDLLGDGKGEAVKYQNHNYLTIIIKIQRGETRLAAISLN